MTDQLLQNTTDIAVLKEQVDGVQSDIKEIKDNHLSHIADDIKLILEKCVQYDLVVKIVFGAIGLILVSLVGLIFTQ